MPEARRRKSIGQGNSEERYAVRSGSRSVQITINFGLTLESVPTFRLFSRRKTPCVGATGSSHRRKHTDTLRHYERLGVLAKPQRTAGNYREYPATSRQRVELIQRTLAIGFSLPELKTLLAERDRGGAPCHRARELLKLKISTVNRKIENLTLLAHGIASAGKRLGQAIASDEARPSCATARNCAV